MSLHWPGLLYVFPAKGQEETKASPRVGSRINGGLDRTTQVVVVFPTNPVFSKECECLDV